MLFAKFGYAESTSQSIFEGEQESTNIIENPVTMPARTPEPTKLDKEVIEVTKMPNKIVKHDDDITFCKVINAISPDEIWVQDAVDSENYYEKYFFFLIFNYFTKQFIKERNSNF